jgi:hypothetical protein
MTPAEIADLLHLELCVDATLTGDCPRYGPGTAHHAYYRDHAATIWARLEPEIGAANVMLAVTVIMDALT